MQNIYKNIILFLLIVLLHYSNFSYGQRPSSYTVPNTIYFSVEGSQRLVALFNSSTWVVASKPSWISLGNILEDGERRSVYVYCNNNTGSARSGNIYFTNGTRIDVNQDACIIPQQPVVSGPTQICRGSTATFTVSNPQSGITYTWYDGTTQIGTGTQLSKTITSDKTYTVKAASACTNRNTNFSIDAVTAAITSNPSSKTICQGTSTTFSVNTTGLNITYQWQYRTPGGTWKNSPDSGAKTKTLTTPAAVAGGTEYKCIVYSCNTTLTSREATLSVTNVPQVTSQPPGQTVCVGQTLNFTVQATGDNLSYTWKTNASGSWQSTSMPRASISNDNNAGFYCIVSNTCASVNSNTATATVNSYPNVNVSPSQINTLAGDPVQLTASGAGSYSWSPSSTLSSGTGSSVTATPNTHTTYTVTGTSNGCSSTAQAGVHILEDLTPNSLNFTGPGGTQTVTISTPISWSASSPGWVTVSPSSGGSGRHTLSISCPVNTGGERSVEIDITGREKLTVNQACIIPVQPVVSGPTEICGRETATFTVSNPQTGISYTWFDGTQAGTGTEFSMQIEEDESFTVRASNACGDELSTNFSINEVTPGIISQPVSKTVCQGQSTTFSVSATGLNLAYQWQYKTPGGDWADSQDTGATTTTLTTSASAISGTGYKCIVYVCNSYYTSDEVTLSVTGLPQITSQPVDQIVYVGETLDFGLQATGDNLLYTWKTNASGSWQSTSMPRASTPNDDGADFYCIVSNTCASVTSNTVTATVQTTVNMLAVSFEVSCDSRGCTMHANVSGGSGNYEYIWSNGVTYSYFVNPENGIYSVRVTDLTTGFSISGSYEYNELPEPYVARNSVKVTSVLKENVLNIADINSLNIYEKQEICEYTDGLNRPVQTILVKGSPGQKDMVRFSEYGRFGRQTKIYLPYTDDTGDGSFKRDALQAQSNYYFNKYDGETHAYAERVFDNSPENALWEISAPGDAWKVNKTGGVSDETGHTTKFNTRVNTAEDSIYRWSLDANGCFINQLYPENELVISTVINEDGKQMETVSNMTGQTILKRNPGESVLNTYYVYNDLGLLKYMLPPETTDSIVELFKSGQGPSAGLLEKMAYSYTYGKGGLLVEKQVPGAGKIYYIYNEFNQPVLTQDGELRNNNRWAFVKYDKYRRAVVSGIYDHGSSISRADMQSIVNRESVLFEFFSTQPGNMHMYTNNAFPRNITASDVLTVAYFDNYNFDVNGVEGFASIRKYVESIDNADFDKDEIFYRVKGKPTGTKVKILDNTGTWMTSVVFYDSRNRMIRGYSENHLGGHNLSLVKYNFAGQVLKYRQVHYKDAGSPAENMYVRPVYGHAGRVLENYFKLNSEDEILLNSFEYDELGQMLKKKVHAETGSNYADFLQEFDYSYNIRGWLTGINNPDEVSDDLFGMKLFYEQAPDTETGVSYSGNISAMQWKTANRAGTFQYSYKYDEHYRLAEADFKEKLSTTWNNTGKYDVKSLSYDKNGNIKSLQRYGETAALLDDLVYTYSNYTQLKSVEDKAQKTGYGFKEKASIAREYLYNDNGNMVGDENKNLDILYNILNLPGAIQMENNKGIEYLYSAAGQKLAKYMYSGDTLVAEKNYLGSYVYNQSGLEYVLIGEGKVIPAGDTLLYEYFITDHLGNVRVSYTKGANGKAEIVQENHYYPFGMTMPGMSFVSGLENKYLYNGKELQDEFGFGMYDYHARFYDPQLGRWHAVDPHAELYNSHSPYNYCFSNPINFTDPTGMDPSGGNPGFSYAVWQRIADQWYNTKSGSRSTKHYGGGGSGHKGYTRVSNGGIIINIERLSNFIAKLFRKRIRKEISIRTYKYQYNSSDISFFGEGDGGFLKIPDYSDPGAQSNGDYQNGKGGNPGVDPEFYYQSVDGIVFNDGSVLSRNDFVFTFNFMTQANARYLGFKNGKHHINFSMGDYKPTQANIRTLTIHEAFGHGVMGYSDSFNNHHQAYFSEIDSRYWQNTTSSFKYHTVKYMWQYYYNEVGYQRMPGPYQSAYDKYINY